jgi:hypothetical protein
MRAPAYAKDLIARRRKGERIGLLVVGVHDWTAGEEFVAHHGVARVVVPDDTLPHELDWSCAAALDCLIIGGSTLEFFAAATMLQAAGAASLWCEQAAGIVLIEPYESQYFPPFLSMGEPVPPALFSRALRDHRRDALMLRQGAYASPIYDAAREAAWCDVFGVGEAAAIALLSEQPVEARAA